MAWMIRHDAQPSTTTFPRTLTALFVAAGALLTGLAACSHADGGPPIPAEDFAKELAGALCDNVGPCCMTEGFPFEQATCRAKADTELQGLMMQTLIDGVVYDAVAARGCVDVWADLARTCADTNTVEDACRDVFRGTRMAGEACTTGSQCVSRSCRQTGMGMTCAPSSSGTSTRAKKGEPCNATCTSMDPISSCSIKGGSGTPPTAQGGCYTNDGLYCSESFVCETVPALGQACTVGSPCADEAFCENGTCAPKRTTGSCSNFDACVTTSYCDFSTQQCHPRKALGEACSTPSECQSPGRCSAGICRRRAIANDDTCAGEF